MSKRKPVGRAFVGEVARKCDHPILVGVFYWPLMEADYGQCADFDCVPTTVPVQRENGTLREVASYSREDVRNRFEIRGAA